MLTRCLLCTIRFGKW